MVEIESDAQGFVTRVEGRDGGRERKVRVGKKVYRFNRVHGTYNSVSDNSLLHDSQKENIRVVED